MQNNQNKYNKKRNTLIDLNIVNLNVESALIHRYRSNDGLSCNRGKFIAIAMEHNTIRN